MHARSSIDVGRDGRGHNAVVALRAEAPLLLRVAGGASAGVPLRVQLVGGAAGPLGGDVLQLDISVANDAALTIRSVAASIAQPGRPGTSGSHASITADVATGAALDWWPEPMVSVRGSDHEQSTTVRLADDTSTLRWVDEVVLGRHAEAGGRLTMRQRVTVGVLPVLHHAVVFDPQRRGIGRHGPERVVVTAVEVGRPSTSPASIIEPHLRGARFALSPTVTSWVALADDLDRARKALATLGLEREG